MPAKFRPFGHPAGCSLRILSATWAALKKERLPNASLKMRQQSILDGEFLSRAQMLPKSRRYFGGITGF